MTLTESLTAAASLAQSACFVFPAGPARETATVVSAALSMAARLAQSGKTRAQIVDAIRRVESIEDNVAAQDAATARAIKERFGAHDE